MIIYYNKETGKIKGLIEGRVHSEENSNVWLGSREENDRIIINWVKDRELNQYFPEIEDDSQKEIVMSIDKKPITIYDFYIDTNLRKIIRKS